MKKLIALPLAAVTAALAFSGCAEAEEYTSKSRYFFSMNTEATLVVSDIFTSEKQTKFDGLCNEASTLLGSIEDSLSATKSGSSIYKFNQAAAGEKVEIDATAYEVLSLAKSVYNLTGGYYNPAVYYSVQAYGFNGSSSADKPLGELFPADEVIEKYNSLSARFGETEITEEDGKFYALKPAATAEIDGISYSMKIDLGGIGKGYAVDEIYELIGSYGFKYGYFSFGTSSIAVMEHYVNGSYSLGFTNPRPDGVSEAYLSTRVKNSRISTSGDYEQFFLYDADGDGKEERYCHVFDPFTGRPVQTGIMSATVIGGSAAEDDALTTAIMAMGREKAVDFIKKELSKRQVAFAFDNGESYEIITNMHDGEYTVKSDKFTVVNTVLNAK